MTIKRYGGSIYTPRIIFSCTPEQLARSQKLFTRDGLRGAVFTRFFDWIMDMVEKHGEDAAARIAYPAFGDDFIKSAMKVRRMK